MHRSLQFDLLYLLFPSPHQRQVFHNVAFITSLSLPPLPLLYTGSYCTTHEMEGCIVPFSLTFCTCCSPPLTSVRYSTMALITSLSPPLPLLYTGSYCTTHEMEGCIVPFSLTFCTCCSPPLTSVRYSTMALITSLSPPLPLLYTGSYCTTHEMEGCIVPFSLTFCTCCSPPLTSVRYSTMALITSLFLSPSPSTIHR